MNETIFASENCQSKRTIHVCRYYMYVHSVVHNQIGALLLLISNIVGVVCELTTFEHLKLNFDQHYALQ